MKLIIIRGPLGIGKTTIAQELARRIQARYISIDETLHQHQLDQDIPPDSGIPVGRYLQAQSIMRSEIDAAFAKQQSVVVDGCFYYREPINALQQWYPGIVEIISLTAPLETCIVRDAGRTLSYGIAATKAVYGLVRALDVGRHIDVTGSIEDSVQQILHSMQL